MSSPVSWPVKSTTVSSVVPVSPPVMTGMSLVPVMVMVSVSVVEKVSVAVTVNWSVTIRRHGAIGRVGGAVAIDAVVEGVSPGAVWVESGSPKAAVGPTEFQAAMLSLLSMSSPVSWPVKSTTVSSVVVPVSPPVMTGMSLVPVMVMVSVSVVETPPKVSPNWSETDSMERLDE